MQKKRCCVCDKEKAKADFGFDKRKPDGLKYSCKECHNKANRERRRASPENHRRTNLEYARSERGRALQRANSLRRKFWPRLTNEQATAEYDRLLAEQKNCCAICDKHQSIMKKAFDVDHDHETGKVRGLLCHKCNYYFVKAHSVDSVIKLANYMKRHHSK